MKPVLYAVVHKPTGNEIVRTTSLPNAKNWSSKKDFYAIYKITGNARELIKKEI